MTERRFRGWCYLVAMASILVMAFSVPVGATMGFGAMVLAFISLTTGNGR